MGCSVNKCRPVNIEEAQQKPKECSRYLLDLSDEILLYVLSFISPGNVLQIEIKLIFPEKRDYTQWSEG